MTPLTEQDLRTNLAAAIRRKAAQVIKGDFDGANELDADIAELERRIDELVVADEPDKDCDTCADGPEFDSKKCFPACAPPACPAWHASTPEELATRAYLEAMASAGYTLLTYREWKLGEKVSMKVETAIKHLTRAGERGADTTLVIQHPETLRHFEIIGSL
jgi:hypothetical protein